MVLLMLSSFAVQISFHSILLIYSVKRDLLHSFFKSIQCKQTTFNTKQCTVERIKTVVWRHMIDSNDGTTVLVVSCVTQEYSPAYDFMVYK